MSMTHDEMIAVIQAHRDGKVVQWKLNVLHIAASPWQDCKSEDEPWNFVVAEYRIKPEPPKPKEWWICYDEINETGEPERPLFCLVEQSTSRKQIHVREVIE